MMKKINPFHLAFPVFSLEESRSFYSEILGCSEGRSSDKWIDFNFFGHQLVAHKVSKEKKNNNSFNPVDGHDVPVPHFGVVLDWEDWTLLAKQLREKGVKFQIEPYIRFKGEKGEQATMFFYDPFGNALEFKAFKNIDTLFDK